MRDTGVPWVGWGTGSSQPGTLGHFLLGPNWPEIWPIMSATACSLGQGPERGARPWRDPEPGFLPRFPPWGTEGRMTVVGAPPTASALK